MEQNERLGHPSRSTAVAPSWRWAEGPRWRRSWPRVGTTTTSQTPRPVEPQPPGATDAPGGDHRSARHGRHHAAGTGTGNAATFGGGGGDGNIKIGFTAPLTGPLAGFGEANDFILSASRTW